ncbi:asparaginase domain-containing protein [Actinomadura hibisca]|uniref:asparaginase domain-containing protein n=1 Tax=Actinomadura hibisca TaxID=68565 RepID=UPI0008330199|nr:asparaginase domain-containing protein [Actinomadura hibisca]
MRRLILLGAGGTIASVETPRGRAVAVPAADLLAAAGEVGRDPRVEVEARDVDTAASYAAGVGDALRLVREAVTAAGEADGVVITYGTDTLEELAMLAALAHGGDAPIVLTGAQRPFDAPGGDGGRNLAAALRWAAAPQARGTGVSVVFADRVLPAAGVRKVDSMALAAFAAPGPGPIAVVDEGGVRTRVAAVRRPAPLLEHVPAALPRVDVAAMYLGCDATALTAARRAGAAGLVLAGFGVGNAPPAVVGAARELLEDGVPVAVSSRTGGGPALGLYSGASAALAEAGALMAGDLSPWQVRLLLAAALDGGGDVKGVLARCRDWLAEAGALALP